MMKGVGKGRAGSSSSSRCRPLLGLMTLVLTLCLLHLFYATLLCRVSWEGKPLLRSCESGPPPLAPLLSLETRSHATSAASLPTSSSKAQPSESSDPDDRSTDVANDSASNGSTSNGVTSNADSKNGGGRSNSAESETEMLPLGALRDSGDKEGAGAASTSVGVSGKRQAQAQVQEGGRIRTSARTSGLEAGGKLDGEAAAASDSESGSGSGSDSSSSSGLDSDSKSEAGSGREVPQTLALGEAEGRVGRELAEGENKTLNSNQSPNSNPALKQNDAVPGGKKTGHLAGLAKAADEDMPGGSAEEGEVPGDSEQAEVEGGQVSDEPSDGKGLEGPNGPEGQKRTKAPPKYVLYRVIGNDMPPLQSAGQLRRNTAYLLKHEAEFPDCRKRWVLNRIANTTEKALIVALLKAHGFKSEDIVDIPFDVDALARAAAAGGGTGGSGSANITLNPILARADASADEMQEFGRKIRDFMGLNHGRNMALDDGLRLGARWILCFDANQFIPTYSWGKIARVAEVADKTKDVRYIEVPMVRLKRQQHPKWLHAGATLRDLINTSEGRMEEGQLIFRNDSSERFNENMAYSLAPKQDLLDRTCSFTSTICACHDTDWWWKVNTPKAMAQRIRSCGVSVRLWNFPDPEALSIRVGDGNARREMRIKSARRYVEFVEGLVERRRAELVGASKRTF